MRSMNFFVTSKPTRERNLKTDKILGGRGKYGVIGAEGRKNQSKGKSFILPVIN